MLNKMMPVQRKYVESIKRLIEYEEAQSLVDARQANASYRSGFWLVVGLAILAVLTGTIAAFLIARSIVSQLGGEPGDAGDIAGRIAAGDLTTKISLRAGDSSSMMSAMSSMQSNLAAIVGSVRISAESVATTADQVAGATQDLSQRTEEQASSLEETASSMEELTSTVKENTGNATQANHFAQSASASAERGGVVVRQVVFTMEAITASSKRIGDIISVIDGIAFQTNILALNAAVEAARAGEQGRGFAVVASEVRSLAHRSAAAAKEIKQLIGQSVDKVELGAKQVVEAGETIDRLVADVKRVSELMGEIANASVEQGQGIDQVCQTVSQMDSVVQQNAAVVEESASAADSMRIQARHLLDAVGKFKIASRQGGSADAQAATQMRASRPGGGQLLSRPGKASAGQMKSGAGKPAKGSIGLDGDWEEF
ncbi:MAG: methyl-accepting chemotaxis protein [Betaproteobacteria bacterium]|nr:methyl-accepting chemotaxis protein [Betaproteobacteria bacterium]